MNKINFRLVIILAALIGLIIVGVYWTKPPELKPFREAINQSFTTANWETFRSEEKGFEIKYPAEWKEIKDPSEEDLVFSVSPNDKPSESGEILPLLGVFVEPYRQTRSFIRNFVPNSSNQVEVGGLLGYEFKQVLGDTVQIVIEVEKENSVYSFQFYYKKENNRDEEIFRKILSSFKFIK